VEVAYDERDVPRCLWDLSLIYTKVKCCHEWHNEVTGYEEATGQALDISEWFVIEFYNLVWCLDVPQSQILQIMCTD
jgi:hypothetical protein